jgi:hypothetical protein
VLVDVGVAVGLQDGVAESEATKNPSLLLSSLLSATSLRESTLRTP